MNYSSPVILMAALLAPLCANASDRLFLQLPVMVDPSAPIPNAVKAECGVEMLLGNHALSALTRRNSQVQTVVGPEQAGADKLIQLTVIAVHGYGGGSWSGPKSISLRADLKQNGSTLGTTVLNRSSTGGVFGGMKGTCDILNRVAVALGKDLANWAALRDEAASVQAPAAAVQAASGANLNTATASTN